MKSLMLIVNPFSGRGLSNSRLGTIVSLFCEEGYAVTVYTTQQDCPEKLVREHAGNYDAVICVGGDGTVSGVASGLMGLETPPPFGFIPTGTSNDMASTLALPRDPAAAVRRLANGQPVPFDIGCAEERYFTYIAAFGAFTGVSYSTPQSAKRSLGHLAYVIGGLASMTAIRPQHTVITYDRGTIEGDYIFGGVTNSTSIAGFVKLADSKVDLGDGQFEVILVKNPVNAVELGTIVTSILYQAIHSENVLLLHTSKIKFTFDEDVVWTMDGEFGGQHRELEIQNLRHALRIIV